METMTEYPCTLKSIEEFEALEKKLAIAKTALKEIEDSCGCQLGHYGTRCCIEEGGIWSLANDALKEIKN